MSRALFTMMVATLGVATACSDDPAYRAKAQDAGDDTQDVGMTDTINDDATDAQTNNSSSSTCDENKRGEVYLLLESSVRMDIDAVSVRPCDINAEAFVYEVIDFVGEGLGLDSVKDIHGFPDSSCDEGFVELGRSEGSYVRLDFFDQNIKKGDQVILYPKACDGYTLDTSALNLYLRGPDDDIFDAEFEETAPGVFLATFVER